MTQWATNPDSFAGLQSSLVAESKIEHWHSELRCWLLTPGNLSFKMAPAPLRAAPQREEGGRLVWGRHSGGPERADGLQLGTVFVEESRHGIWAIRDRLSPSKAASHVEMRKFSAAELWPSAEATSPHTTCLSPAASSTLWCPHTRHRHGCARLAEESWAQHQASPYLWLPPKVQT